MENSSHIVQTWSKKLFQKKSFPRRVPLDFEKPDLTTLTRNFSYWAEIILLKSRKKKNKLWFSESFHASQKRFSGHVNCTFENSAQKIMLEIRFFCWIFGKGTKKVFSSKLLFFKTFHWGRKKHFLPPSLMFFGRVSYFFWWSSKFLEKIIVFLMKNLFFSSFSFRYVECRFGNRSKKLQLKVKLFSTPCDEMMKQVFFTANLINISPGHSESSFENPAENLLHRVPKWQKTIFQKIYLSSERYSRHSEASFDNRTDTYVSPLDRNVFNKSPKLFSRQSEADKKTMVFSIKAFFPRFSFR